MSVAAVADLGTFIDKPVPVSGTAELPPPLVLEQLCGFIKSGAYPWTAAECLQIDRRDFQGWLRRGRLEPDSPYGEFRRAIKQAAAQARVVVECSVRKDHVKFWLSYGPGRQRAGQPGWACPVRLPRAERSTARFRLADNRVVSVFLQLLEPHPDLKQQFLTELEKQDLLPEWGAKPVGR